MKPFALFMDNASYHKSKEVKGFYNELQITPLWNVAYSPEFNPIESVFSQVKRIFSKQRLNDLVNKVGFNIDREVKKAFKVIKADHCVNCVKKS